MKILMTVVLALGLAAARAADPRADAFSASLQAEAGSDFAGAIQALEKIGSAGAADYYTQVRLGWLRYRAQQWKESQVHYRKAAQIVPQALEPLLGLMMVQMAAGQNEDALRTGQSVLARDPNHYTALSRTAWIFYLKGDFRRAITIYRKLTTLYPCDTEMLLGLGYALQRSGDGPGAADCFRRVLLLSPDNTLAKDGLSAAR